jgi:hypothetical protein
VENDAGRGRMRPQLRPQPDLGSAGARAGSIPDRTRGELMTVPGSGALFGPWEDVAYGMGGS